jgi:hypothetical protein
MPERCTREFVYGLGASLGSVAFSAMMAAEEKATGPLSPQGAAATGEGEKLHLSHGGGRAIPH